MSDLKPLIVGLVGPVFTAEYGDYVRKHQPLGLIVQQSNCHNPEQLRRFVRQFRRAAGREDAPVMIDQEGGRVQRLAGRAQLCGSQETHPGSRHWPRYPSMRQLTQTVETQPERSQEIVYRAGLALGAVLAWLEIDLNAAPVIDVPIAGANEIVGDRAFAASPQDISILAGLLAKGLHEYGVMSCIKHVPGHGRALADSHLELPVVTAPREVLEQTDFVPLRDMMQSSHRFLWAMSAHIVYTALDAEQPATQSRRISQGLLRRELGFCGVLCSDCIGMEALSGSLAERAVACQEAGCDVICAAQGDMAAKEQIAAALGPASPKTLARLRRAQETVAQQRIHGDGCDWRKRYEDLRQSMARMG